MEKPQNVLSADPIQVAPATLQMDGYYVKEVQCSVRNNLDEESHLALGTGLHIQPSHVMSCPSPSVNVEIWVGQPLRDQPKFRAMLKIKSDDEEDENPYVFSIKLAGFFSVVNGDFSKAKRVLYYRNAVMLLYSAAREIIASTTARGPFPAFILPTLTFDLTDRTWAAIAKANNKTKQIEGKMPLPQLPPVPKKTSKKKASKKATTK